MTTLTQMPGRVVFDQRGPTAKSRRWVIVLAGGDGDRMRPFIEEQLGCHRPKQYCAFTGTRTMLDHTYARATALVHPQNVVTVIGPGHSKYIPARHPMHRGIVVKQTENRGTAPGIFLPLCHILESDPEATVLILPSDHFIYPENRFLAQVRQTTGFAERHPGDIVIMGASPDCAETDYGWLSTARSLVGTPVERLSSSPARLTKFHEKPSEAKAAELYREGALWNTLILAVKAKTLWRLGEECVPDLMDALRSFRGILQAERVGRLRVNDVDGAMRQLLKDLDSVDFSTSILERVAEHIVASPLRGIQWSDWGRPERVRETISRIGAVPNFSEEEANRRADDASKENRKLVNAVVAHAAVKR